MSSDGQADSKTVIDTIFSIAPILPGQQRRPTQPRSQPVPQLHSAPSQSYALPDSSQSESATVQSKSQPISQPQNHPVQSTQPQQSLLDLDEPSKFEPIAGNPLHPTSNPKQIIPQETATPGASSIHDATTVVGPSGNASKTSSTLMDDQLNNQMSSMTMQPLTPTAGRDRPIKRTDTETSDVEVFVDAEG